MIEMDEKIWMMGWGYVRAPRIGVDAGLGKRPKFEMSRGRAESVRPPSAMSSSTSSQGVVDRVQNFVSEHKHAVLLGTAAALVAIGGVAYYASSSRGPGGDVERGEGKKDKKKSKKRKTVKDKDGPVLEERAPKTAVSEEGELSV